MESSERPKVELESINSRKVEGNSAVTSVSVVNGVLAGLESGVLMFSEIQAEESRLVPVKGLQQSVMKGSSKAVASLYVSQYWEPRKGQAIPALFAVHTRGFVHVVSLESPMVVAYGNGPYQRKSDYILQYSDVEVVCVTNGYAEELSRSKRVVAPSGAREQSDALPLEAPKFLIVRSGRDIVNYNLHAFNP